MAATPAEPTLNVGATARVGVHEGSAVLIGRSHTLVLRRPAKGQPRTASRTFPGRLGRGHAGRAQRLASRREGTVTRAARCRW